MLPVRVQLLLTAVAVAVTAADLSWLDANLVPNPGFESLAADTGLPEGWTVQASAGGGTAAASDGQVPLEGARAFRLEVTAAGAWIRASSARITVEGGAVYLFSVAFRQEGFNPTGGADTYAGVSSHPAVHWFDAAGQQVGGSTVVSRFPYGPCAWDLRDALERAPAQARSARILVTLSLDAKAQSGQAIASKLWLDAAQLRHYRPPPTPDWARGETARNVDGGIAENRLLSFFVGSDEQFHSRNGKWSRTTSDSAAERGVCLLAPAAVGQGMMAHSPYFPALPPGLYRLRVRARCGGQRLRRPDHGVGRAAAVPAHARAPGRGRGNLSRHRVGLHPP